MARRKEIFGVTVDGDISGLKSAMAEATKVFNSTERSLKNINKELQLDPTNVEALTKKQTLLNKAIQNGENALSQLKSKQDEIVNDSNFQKGNTELNEKYTELELKIAQVTDRLAHLKEELSNMPSPNTQAFINKMESMEKTFDTISQKTAGLSKAFSTMLIGSFMSSKEYETNIANIRKIVGDLSDETVSDLKEIAIQTGKTFGDVSEYATFAGALGLAENKIAGFAKTMIDLNTATGGAFSGEMGAKSIVVFLNNLGIGIEQAENFGSAISAIGDAYADVGDETLQMATAMADLSTIANVNQYDLIGLAGVMKNLGLQTEASSSAMTRTFMAIESAIASGGDKLELFAKTSGKTSQEFINSWNQDALNAFMDFVKGLRGNVFGEIDKAVKTSSSKLVDYSNTLGWSVDLLKQKWGEDANDVFEQYIKALADLGDESDGASVILKDLGISSVRTSETLLRLSGQSEEVAKAVQLANDAWNENTALSNKANIIYETTETKLNGLFESIRQLGASIVDTIGPDIKIAIDSLSDFIKKLNDVDPVLKKTILILMATFAGFSKTAKGISDTINATKNLTKFTAQLIGKEKLLTTAIGSGTFGAYGAAAALTVAVGALGYAMLTSESEFDKLTDKAKELKDSFVETKEEADLDYVTRLKQIESSREYIDTIDELIGKLKEGNLTEEESAKAKENLEQYIKQVNEALGTEAIVFDETTGKLIVQGQEADTVKGKFEQLAFEVKKEAWLEAHKGELTQAYKDTETATQGLQTATNEYNNLFSGEYQHILELIAANKGDVNAVISALEEEGVPYDLTTVADLATYYGQYKDIVEQYQGIITSSNESIKKYEDIATSDITNFDERVGNLSNSLGTLYENLENDNLKLDSLQKDRDTYASTLDTENQKHDITLQKYDEEIKKLEDEIKKQERDNELVTQMYGKHMENIRQIDAWTNQVSYKNIVLSFSTVGYPSFANGILPSYNDVVRSGGFGEKLSNVVRDISNSIVNSKRSNAKYNSGGYSSGGYNITLNASFVANGSLDEAQALRFADLMTERINDNLGGMI